MQTAPLREEAKPASAGTIYTSLLEKYQPPRPSHEYLFQQKARAAYIVHTMAFVVIMFFFGILSLVLSKPTESVMEKRSLAAMPGFSVDALVEGTYTRDLEMHYADTFPFRDGFVSFAAWFNEIKGVRVDDVKIYGPATPPPVEEPPPRREVSAALPSEESVESKAEPEPREIYRAVEDGAVGEQNGSVFVYKGMGIQLFGGSKGMAEWYADAINSYAKAWGSAAQVYNIVIPTVGEFVLPEKYRSMTNAQEENLAWIAAALDDRVRVVDAYTAIGVHADEYVYFNADHHWTGRGAYYAYTAFCESAGLEALSLSDYETRRLEDFYGTMYTYTNDAKLASDYVEYYIMPVECTAVRYERGDPHTPKEHSVWAEYAVSPNSYSVFLHGDYPLIKISTKAGTGRKALLVKESFGNAFAPFLIPHYDEVYVVDQRYFELNLTEYVKSEGIDDVIFLNNIFAANTGYHIECIESMR